MRAVLITAVRCLASLLVFWIVVLGSTYYGARLVEMIGHAFPPLNGEPSIDPRGRGDVHAADVVGIGAYIGILLGAIGGWLAWLWTDKKYRSVDLAVASPLFLIFAAVSAGNYTHFDVLFTRDAQAVLNILLAATGVTVIATLQRTLQKCSSLLIYTLGSCVLVFGIYAFVAIPLFYSLSFLSWKLGAGEFDSMESAAKAISAAASVISVVGLQWKHGWLLRTTRDSLTADN